MPNKHAEDGPLEVKVAKTEADALLADPKNHGQPPEHAASQKAEKLDDPAHQKPATIGPEWKQVGDTFVHDTEG